MFRVAIRLQVNVGLVMRERGRLDGIVVHLFGQLLESIVGLLAYQITLFQPAFDSGGRAHVGKTAIAAQDLHCFSVLYCAGFVVDRGHLIAQESLRRGDIGNLQLGTAPVATGEQAGRQKQK